MVSYVCINQNTKGTFVISFRDIPLQTEVLDKVRFDLLLLHEK